MVFWGMGSAAGCGVSAVSNVGSLPRRIRSGAGCMVGIRVSCASREASGPCCDAEGVSGRSSADASPAAAVIKTDPSSPISLFARHRISPATTQTSTAAAAATIRTRRRRAAKPPAAPAVPRRCSAPDTPGAESSRRRRSHPSAGGVGSASRSSLRITSIQSLFRFIIPDSSHTPGSGAPAAPGP